MHGALPFCEDCHHQQRPVTESTDSCQHPRSHRHDRQSCQHDMQIKLPLLQLNTPFSDKEHLSQKQMPQAMQHTRQPLQTIMYIHAPGFTRGFKQDSFNPMQRNCQYSTAAKAWPWMLPLLAAAAPKRKGREPAVGRHRTPTVEKYSSSTRRWTAASVLCALCKELCSSATSERAASASARAPSACCSAASLACSSRTWQPQQNSNLGIRSFD